MKNKLKISICFLLFIMITITGFCLVDKSFNSMMISEDTIHAFSFNVDDNGCLEGSILNQNFSININSIMNNIDKLKESVYVYVEKVRNGNSKNVI